jgi:hypothetical protein
MTEHTLYTPADFTSEQCCPIDGLQIARLVVEGGLGICKKCGAAEIQLDEFRTCEEFDAHKLEDQDNETQPQTQKPDATQREASGGHQEQ